MAVPIKCPKCQRVIEPAGEATSEAFGVLPVYQCDDCTRPWVFGGVTFEVAYIFAVTGDGELIDPASLDGLD